MADQNDVKDRAEEAAPSDKLFVGGLAWAATDDDLQGAFEPYGEIVEAVVIRYPDTGRSKGYGFVQFTSVEQAEKAKEELDGKEIVGRAVKVNFAHKKERSENR
ncbi:MAG: RNA recognition motif [bacterium ADurb.Bin400]|nr:MAG: RNA recognition motif [bacterium ADurb.Bin400]